MPDLSAKDLARFWAKVDKSGECWLWRSAKNWGGYGVFSVNNRNHMAHRIAYELLVGPIPAGLTLDHLCRVRHCVNPSHLEPVTNRTNILRGDTLPRQNALKTHCLNGHEFNEENTAYLRDGSRECRVCRRAREQTPERKLQKRLSDQRRYYRGR